MVGACYREEGSGGEAFWAELDDVVGLCSVMSMAYTTGSCMLSRTLMSILCSLILRVSGPSCREASRLKPQCYT